MKDEYLSAEEKISLALAWVASYQPVAVTTVFANWRVEPSFACRSLATDGQVLWFNPAFVDRCSPQATRAIVLHEVGHVLSNHEHRRGTRDHENFCCAADLDLNCKLWNGFVAAYNGNVTALREELIESSIGGCFVGHGPYKDLPPNLSAEEYYDLLNAMNPPPPPPQSKAQPQPGKGSIEDASDESELSEDEARMILAVLTESDEDPIWDTAAFS